MPRNLYKRLVYSLAIILVWLGFVVEGSHALLSATATLKGSTINTGTADLLINNSQDPTPSSFSASQPGFAYNLIPGQSQDYYFYLKNSSASDLPFDINVVPSVQNQASDLFAATNIEFTPVDSSGTPSGIPVAGTLASMTNQISPLGTTISQNGVQRYRLRVNLSSSYVNQNQTLSFDLAFTGVQHYAP